MGNIFCSEDEEAKQPDLFDATPASLHDLPPDPTSTTTVALPPISIDPVITTTTTQSDQKYEALVQTTGRSMVAIQTQRDGTGYYDQGFAAALSDHLEQTTQFPNKLQYTLPIPPPSTNLSQILAEPPQWFERFDTVAERYLEQVTLQKEKVFVNCEPMVESLL